MLHGINVVYQHANREEQLWAPVVLKPSPQVNNVMVDLNATSTPHPCLSVRKEVPKDP